jgi:hemoglobin
MSDPELFAKIGADKLREVITDFYSRIFGDVMIGFMFEGKNRQHLIDREWELAAALLGAPGVKYTGRPMRPAHAQHTIFGGHFERRLQLLKETLRDHAIDPEVQKVWIDHTLSLRSQITRDKGSECKDTGEAGPKLAVAPPSPNPDARIKLGKK